MRIKGYCAILVGISLLIVLTSFYLAIAGCGMSMCLCPCPCYGGGAIVCNDAVSLSTSSTKLYYNDNLDKARSAITKTELPTLLADGMVIGDSGTVYLYRQAITLSNKTISYSTSGGDLTDPELIIGPIGIEGDDYLYQLSIIFNRNINLSDADLLGSRMQILGRDFTIGAGSTCAGTAPVLYLYEEGGRKLKIGGSSRGSTVKEGAEETSIYGTKAFLSTSSGLCSRITIKIATQSATRDYISVGKNFTDPVFGGLITRFVDIFPNLTEFREDVIVRTDNSRNAMITFTSALAGEAGEKSIYFAHDDDTSENTVATRLADSSNYTIHVKEGEEVLLSEYTVINAGDYGRIVRVTELPSGAFETTSKIQLEDAITGKNIFEGGLTVGSDGRANTNIDGSTYYFNVTRNVSTNGLQVTWGTGATAGSTGNVITLFPRIKTAKGGWIAFLTATNITDITGASDMYSLPGIENLANYETGLAIANDTSHIAYGNVNYIFTGNNTANANTLQILGIDMNGDGILNNNDCLLNGTVTNNKGAALLFIEEKKATDIGDANNGDVICTFLDLSSSNVPIEISVATPKITNVNSGLQFLTSDQTLQRAITRYGSFVEYNSIDNDKVTIKYPETQMYADIEMGCQNTTTNDNDGDGIPDYSDRLLGNRSSISTNILSLNVIINGSDNLNQSFDGIQKVEFKEQNDTLLEFDFDFSSCTLNLSNVTIEKQSDNSSLGSIIIKGIDLTLQNKTKTVWIDNLANASAICIIDVDIVNISEMSSNCDGVDELWLVCGNARGQYYCEFNSTLNKYRISGLNHSAVKECSCDLGCGPCAIPGTGSGGGGGGRVDSGGGGGGGGGWSSEGFKPPANASTNQTNGTVSGSSGAISSSGNLANQSKENLGESRENETSNITENTLSNPITGAVIGIGARINNLILIQSIFIIISIIIFIITISFLIANTKKRK